LAVGSRTLTPARAVDPAGNGRAGPIARNTPALATVTGRCLKAVSESRAACGRINPTEHGLAFILTTSSPNTDMRITTLTFLAALSAPLAAQTYVVIPSYCVDAEGGSNNTIPFWGTAGFYRYQQPTSDLKGSPHLFTEIAWRRDGTLGMSTSYGP